MVQEGAPVGAPCTVRPVQEAHEGVVQACWGPDGCRIEMISVSLSEEMKQLAAVHAQLEQAEIREHTRLNHLMSRKRLLDVEDRSPAASPNPAHLVVMTAADV